MKSTIERALESLSKSGMSVSVVPSIYENKPPDNGHSTLYQVNIAIPRIGVVYPGWGGSVGDALIHAMYYSLSNIMKYLPEKEGDQWTKTTWS